MNELVFPQPVKSCLVTKQSKLVNELVLQGIKPDVDLIGFIGTVENQGRRGEYWFTISHVPKCEGHGAPILCFFIYLGGPKAHGDTTEEIAERLGFWMKLAENIPEKKTGLGLGR